MATRLPLRATAAQVSRSFRTLAYRSHAATASATTATTATSPSAAASRNVALRYCYSTTSASAAVPSTSSSSTCASSPMSSASSSSSSLRISPGVGIGLGLGLATVSIAYADSQAQTPVQTQQAQVQPHTAQTTGEALSNEEIAAVAAAINDLLDNDEDDGLGPTLVRLAWHASGTYDKESNTGGSDGATMRFIPESQHAANAGLHVAREALEQVKKLFPQISYADLWTLAGAVAIEHMGGPKIVWRQGRRDAIDSSACPPDGRLPDADKGQVGGTIRHVRTIFNRQGFDDSEMVALIGAHALGRCHTDRSGYDGPWTRAPTTFSNLYFKELLENTWTLRNWEGPDQFQDPSGDLMMLPADMALLWDKDFRKYVVEFAEDEDKFFQAFAVAFQKLEENGVKAFASAVVGAKPWYQFW